jgi:hypothetical protein
MSTLFNFWHYLVLLVVSLVFIGGIALAFKDENARYRGSIITSFFLVSLFLASVGLYAVDKITKVAKLYKIENKRNLSTEMIMFSGIVKNEGDHEIGKLYLKITLLNNAQGAGGSSKAGYFIPSEFVNPFLSFGWGPSKPPQVVEEFVVAENFKPGEVRDFMVYMRYPSYFQGFSTSYDISAH